ncbi:Trigger factor [Candidatus Rubidus massiliensis]|nr:MAG: trigger factor [Chlamydia sp. 32-24]CDZ80883.1 Trigger factor [Candidatus Rubidus massiliensis]
MANANSEYKKDHIKVSVEDLPDSQVYVIATLSPSFSAEHYRSAIRNINKEVSVPGFRKGKAPENYIQQKFPSQIKKEWGDIMVESAFKETISLANIHPFNRESVKKVEIKKLSKDDDSIIEFTIEIRPSLPNLDFSSFQLEKIPSNAVNENDVNSQIAEIQKYHTKWEEVSNRPVQAEDKVTVDLYDLKENKLVQEDAHFVLNQNNTEEWIQNALIGTSIGQEVEANQPKTECHDCDEGHDHEHHHHEPVHYRFIVKKIESPIAPEINEELAKKVGVDSVEQMYERIRENLAKKEEVRIQQEYRDKLAQQILDKHPFAIPASLVDKELNSEWNRLKNSPSMANKSEDELEQEKKNLKNRILESFRMLFLVQALADEHKLHPSEEEVSKELYQEMIYFSQVYGDVSKVNWENYKTRLYTMLLENKALDFMIDKIFNQKV